MTKTQRILIGLLVIQLALAAFLLWPRGTHRAAAAALLNLKAEDVRALTITDDAGRSVKLAKTGEAWIAPEAGDFPVDAPKLTSVLTKLAGLTAGEPVAQTAASQAQLQVADAKFARKIELQTAGGAQTLYLGTTGGAGATHVRLGGQDAIYLSRGISTWEVGAELGNWIDTLYLSVPVADVTGFVVQNANGTFNFSKDAAGGWQLAGLAAGEQLDAAAVNSLLGQAASLRMTKPLGQAEQSGYGIGQPRALVTLNATTGGQARTVTLRIGAQEPTDKSYVVKSSESAYYVRVAESSVQTLLAQTRAGLLVQATPTPAP